MRESQDVGFLGRILIFMGIILLFPVLVVLLFYFLISQVVIKIRKKIELRNILRDKNGQIILLYSNYNEFNFLENLNIKHIDIECILVNDPIYNDVFLSHLCRGFNTKAYPVLVKVKGKEVIKKEHYNSFKYYVKRNNDVESFFLLLEKSVNNLKNERKGE